MCPVGEPGAAGGLAHPSAVFAYFPSHATLANTLMGAIFCIEAFGTIHGIFGAVEVVRMQPLSIFTLGDTRSISIADLNLLIASIGALVDT